MYSAFQHLSRVALGSAVIACCLPAEEAPPTMNRLAREKSPYLLQHATNPVDWYPWGDEAFEKARRENKPVLLSIGYATCHWCHVMERESFNDPKVAAFLNEHFVAIKLDREERPDLDRIYMRAMQGLGMGGGWPLNVFLTPDRQPFIGGTYFPPEPKMGLPSFLDVLRQVRDLWKEREHDVRHNAAQLAEEMKRVLTPPAPPADAALPDATPLARLTHQLLQEFDVENGGFGGAPKFPQAQALAALLRQGVESGDTLPVRAVVQTLRRMAAGGIYDQIGGGFARYAVDAAWLIPHFEKMLYDNAQLASLTLDTYAVTRDESLAQLARGIFRYVLRDMTSPDGAFYSAEDADSEGHEGKFYTWTKAEMESVLAPEEAALAVAYWGVTEKGNFVDHSRPDPLPGQNVLHVADRSRQLTPEEAGQLERARLKLFEVRSLRVRPLRDDKVLASWNGLMLSACVRGAMILEDDALLDAACKNAQFLRSRLWDAETQTLSHRWREGEKDATQLLTGYAFTLQGVLDLYQATLDPQWLTWAIELAETMEKKFYDPEAGGFYQSADDDSVLMRLKDDSDDAEPAGNSVAAGALWQLAALTGNPKWRQQVEATLKFFGPRLQKYPVALPLLAQVAVSATREPFRVVIAGEASTPEAVALRRAVFAAYQPNVVVSGTIGPVEEFARTLPARDGRPTAYVCSGTFCHEPTHDSAQVRALLKPSK